MLTRTGRCKGAGTSGTVSWGRPGGPSPDGRASPARTRRRSPPGSSGPDAPAGWRAASAASALLDPDLERAVLRRGGIVVEAGDLQGTEGDAAGGHLVSGRLAP